jgi:hypothetical protein
MFDYCKVPERVEYNLFGGIVMDIFEFMKELEKGGEITKVLRSSSSKFTSMHDQFRAGCVEEFMSLMGKEDGCEALLRMGEMIFLTGVSAQEEGNDVVAYMAKLSWLGFLSGFQGAMEEIMLKREESV